LENWLGARVAVLWRSEWVERKSGLYKDYLMPHFHLLAFGVPFIENETARSWWKKALGWDAHVDTDVRAAPKDARVSYYVSKYASKLPHLDIASYHNKMETTGRQWGVTRKHLVPMCPRECSRPLNAKEVERAKSIGRACFSRYGEFGEGGFTILGADKARGMRARFAFALDEGTTGP
jgi:hypothetical protein